MFIEQEDKKTQQNSLHTDDSINFEILSCSSFNDNGDDNFMEFDDYEPAVSMPGA